MGKFGVSHFETAGHFHHVKWFIILIRTNQSFIYSRGIAGQMVVSRDTSVVQ